MPVGGGVAAPAAAAGGAAPAAAEEKKGINLILEYYLIHILHDDINNYTIFRLKVMTIFSN